jgi:hypothetical protein
MRELVRILIAALSFAPQVLADTSDDTLRFFLSKSELVLVGTIAAEPIGEISEAGVVNYACSLVVSETLAGVALKEQTISLRVLRFETQPEDRLPYLKKGAKVVVFLKARENAYPVWQTADFWFGVQPYSSKMASSLKTLASRKP